MQGKLNDLDVDQVINSIKVGLLNNDLTKIAHPPNESHNSNPKKFVLPLIGEAS